MSQIGYYLIVKPISLLPFPILYLISDFLYLVMYRLIGYRVKVVRNNLTNSFPDKDEQWIKSVESKFYRHFCDLLVEGIKLFSISEKQIRQRFIFENPEELDVLSDQGQSVILVGGHYNNWEVLASGIHQQCKHKAVGIYKPLSNKFYDKKAQQSRGKFGLRMLATKDVPKFFAEEADDNTMTIFGADQSPTHSKHVHWMTFLNQESAVALGTERFAKKNNYPVFYGYISKVKRGHYSFRVELITDKPNETAPGQITASHTKRLEQQILEQPEYWLWTHRRWKRVRREHEVLTDDVELL